MATVITTRTGLENISLDLAGDYELGANIDLSGSAWTPLGIFTGSLDGKGYEIQNMSTTKGLFTQLFEATVTNLKLTDVTISHANAASGTVYIGSLAAEFIDSTVTYIVITNPTFTGSYTSADYDIGGLAGRIAGGTVTDISISGLSMTYSYTLGAVECRPCGVAYQITGMTAFSRIEVAGTITVTTDSAASALYVTEAYGICYVLQDTTVPSGASDIFANVDINLEYQNESPLLGGSYRASQGIYLRTGCPTGTSTMNSMAGVGVVTITTTHGIYNAGSVIGGFPKKGAYAIAETGLFFNSDTVSSVNASNEVAGATTANLKLLASYTAASWDMSLTASGSNTIWKITEGSYPYLVMNQPPVITSNGGGDTAAISVVENQTAVTTVTATDPDGDTVTFSITGGADAALFTIDEDTGVLTFITAPDYEDPDDADADNVYIVEVTADDGNGGTDVQTISVTVTDATGGGSGDLDYGNFDYLETRNYGFWEEFICTL